MDNSILSKLNIFDCLIIAGYLIVLLVLAWRTSRKTSNDPGVFLANKSLGWYSIGFNMWGTNVGPSMLLAFASIGYSTGIVALNFEWYAFIFLMLLALAFAPKYIASKVNTMPEFLGKRFGSRSQDMMAVYAIIKILISWLSLGLFAGGTLVKQILGVDMGYSVTVLVAFAGLFAYMGGLKVIARINVFQMLLLIVVSFLLMFLSVQKAGGLGKIWHSVPSDYWNLLKPSSDPSYPWYAILLGYPVAAVAFFCTDQAMVQSVLGARNLEQGQLGVNFIGWLKILSLPLFILTGVTCYVLFPGLKDPDLAYMTMVTSLFPPGLNGLVIVVLIAVLVGTIGSSLNSLSTVFTMDIYRKSINPNASPAQMRRVGQQTVIVGCILAIGIALGINSIKGVNLFDVFQSVLGFIAPPLSVVFLLSVYWPGITARAVNLTLSAGSAFSLLVGVCYLWIFPKDQYPQWPHYLVLSFLIFLFLLICAVLISLFDKNGKRAQIPEEETRSTIKTSSRVKTAWVLLSVVMVLLYIIFNRH